MRIQLFGQHVHLSILGLAVIEAAICFGAPFLAIYLRFLGDLDPDAYADFVGGSVVFSLSMLTSMTAMGLYASQQRARTGGTALRLVGAAIVAFLVLAVVVLPVPDGRPSAGACSAWTVLIALAGCFVVRMLFMHTISEDAMKRKVLIYGAGKRAEAFMQLRRRTDRRGFIVAGFVSADDDEILVPARQAHLRGRHNPFTRLVRDRGVTEVVVAVDDRRKKFPVEDLLNCRLRGINVIDIVSFLERETGKVRIDMLSPSWLIFSGGFRRDPLREGAERMFDIFVSIMLLAITWPIALLAWLAIKLEDGWQAPAFYHAGARRARRARSSRSRSSAACASTPSRPAKPRGPARTTHGSLASAASSARRALTNCRSC